MMRSNTIFVEGVADERFIWQLAEHLLEIFQNGDNSYNY